MQFLGFIIFITMALVGFWLMTFLIHFIGYWLTFGALENFGVINKDKFIDQSSPVQDGFEHEEYIEHFVVGDTIEEE